MKDAVHQADKEVEIDADDTVMITAEQLLSGRIIRTGLTSNSNDYPQSASAIISAFKAKVKSISDRDTIQNGSSFQCQLLNDTDEWWGLYSNLAGGVRVGGQLGPGHVIGGASAILEIIVKDQASLGAGHSDRVWICVSRCSTQIADDD
jgi:hypothetical protein